MKLSIHLILAVLFVFSNLVYAAEYPLYPQTISLTKGTVSTDQPISVLTVIDQQNREDNWDSYKDFTPSAKGLTAIFKFKIPLPAIIDAKKASLVVNYMGWKASQQTWIFSIYSFKTRKWTNLGNNRSVRSWVWSILDFKIPKNLSDYVKNGYLKVKYQTKSNQENSFLDYISLHINPSKPAFVGCNNLNANVSGNEKFRLIKHGCLRGANMYQGEQYASSSEIWSPRITSDDLAQLRANHANYVNFSVPGPYSVNPPYKKKKNFFRKLTSLIHKAESNDLFTVISIRTGPGRGEGDITDDAGSNTRRTLFNHAKAQKAFIRMWKNIAQKYKGNSNIVGYEILVEPHDVSRKAWRNLAQKTINAIRRIDKSIPILVSPAEWSGVDALAGWKPLKGNNIVYTIHQYEPYQFTHENKHVKWSRILSNLYKDVVNWVTKYKQPIIVNEYGFEIFNGDVLLNKGNRFMRTQLRYLDNAQLSHAAWIWEVENAPGYDYEEFDFKEDPRIFNSIKASWRKNIIFPSMQ